MWPTLWAIRLAERSHQHLASSRSIFWLGVLPSSAGWCDKWLRPDRKVDRATCKDRTKNRPIALWSLYRKKEALILFVNSPFWSLILVRFTDIQTILTLVCRAYGLAALYAFMKRIHPFCHMLFLGLAFFFGIPYAYSAQGGDFSRSRIMMFS